MLKSSRRSTKKKQCHTSPDNKNVLQQSKEWEPKLANTSVFGNVITDLLNSEGREWEPKPDNTKVLEDVIEELLNDVEGSVRVRDSNPGGSFSAKSVGQRNLKDIFLTEDNIFPQSDTLGNDAGKVQWRPSDLDSSSITNCFSSNSVVSKQLENKKGVSKSEPQTKDLSNPSRKNISNTRKRKMKSCKFENNKTPVPQITKGPPKKKNICGVSNSHQVLDNTISDVHTPKRSRLSNSGNTNSSESENFIQKQGKKKATSRNKLKSKGGSKSPKNNSVSKERTKQKTLSEFFSKKTDVPTVNKVVKNCKPPSYSSSHRALDNIISDVQNEAIVRDKIKALEQQITSSTTTVKLLSPSPKKKAPSRTFDSSKKQPPVTGLQIIDHRNHECLFSFKDLEKMWDAMDIEDALVFKMMFSNTSCNLLLSYQARKGKHPDKNVLLLVFRLLSIHSDSNVVNKCLTYLLNVMEERDAGWVPSLHEIVQVLVNYGVTAHKSCPLRKVFQSKGLRITGGSPCRKKGSPVESLNSKHCKVLDLYNLSLVLTLLSRLADAGLYEDKVLVDLVLLICWLFLDPQVQGLQPQMQMCTSSCLSAITASGWDTKWMMELSRSLSLLTDSPEHILKVCNFLLPLGRSQSLTRVVSLQVAHHYLNAPYSFKISPTATDVANLLRCCKLASLLKDAEFFKAILEHIDYAVGTNIDKADMASLKDLSHIYRSTAARIMDSIHSPEYTQVKSMLLSSACKWSVLHQQFVHDTGSTLSLSPWSRNKHSGDVEDEMCNRAKIHLTFSPNKSKKDIPSYQTKADEMNSTSVFLSKLSCVKSKLEENIPSYQTKEYEMMSGKTDVANGQNHSSTSKESPRGGKRKKQAVRFPGRKKLNFGTGKDC